ncbi:MAG: succinylglutamate desuccinylase, partial [Saprospiraceae bacterium]|nr:succinylglutamate desuccinylase [Saprospiraceae bacterium]
HTLSRELAQDFNAPFTIAKANIAKTLRKSALNRGIPILVYEGGESLRLDGYSIQKGLDGLKRLMAARGFTGKQPQQPNKTHNLNRTTWVRADRSGIFQWTKESGSKVFKGEPLGFICDPYGESKIFVKAKRDGFIIGHNNAPVISQGDALFHIGFFD